MTKPMMMVMMMMVPDLVDLRDHLDEFLLRGELAQPHHHRPQLLVIIHVQMIASGMIKMKKKMMKVMKVMVMLAMITLVVMVPSPSMSNSLKATLISATWPGVVQHSVVQCTTV